MIDISTHNAPMLREQARFLAKSYNTLEYSQALRVMLNKVFIDVDFTDFTKIMLHQYFNDSLITNYAGEAALKYQLFRQAAGKKLVGAFETRVRNSRVDFLTINGVSSSFEIKSELDNLHKLRKQSTNYIKVFEYNSVVIDSRHKKSAFEMLPPSYGIVCFTKGRRVIERKPCLNNAIDPRSQLDMLTKKELNKAFNGLTCRDEIEDRFPGNKINDQFKDALKSRYRNRWNFLVQHKNNILPIDLQFFFNRNIDPNLIYNYG